MKDVYEVNSSKEECVKQVIDFLTNNDKCKIINRTENSMKFVKGSFWNWDYSSKNARIMGILDFEEDKQTKITIRSQFGEVSSYRIVLDTFIVIFGIITIFLMIQSVKETHANLIKLWDFILIASFSIIISVSIIDFSIDYYLKIESFNKLSKKLQKKLNNLEI